MYRGNIKYIDIAEKLRHHIITGAIDGANLLSERELAKQFNVTRGTIRKALNILKEQNLINAKIGSGNFISRKEYTKDLSMVLSFDEYRKLKNLNARSEIFEFKSNVILQKDFEFALLFSEMPIYQYVKMIYIDDKPYLYEKFYLPSSIFENFSKEKANSVVDYIENQKKLKIGKYYQTIQVNKPSLEIANYLNIKQEPILNMITKGHLEDSTLFQISEQYIHPDFQLQLATYR